jgi:SAM-dependent methyltransferase
MSGAMSSRATARLRHYAKRVLGRPTIAPPVRGVADADWYNANYAISDRYAAPWWESEYLFLWPVLADRIRRAGAHAILDIGCGSGQFAACLFALTSIERYTGLDFSAQAVAIAKRACPQGTFVVGDATTTTIHREAPHDLLTCTEMLEHVPDDQAVVARFTPGMPCLCTVPNFPHETHVRHFRDVAEVEARYGRWFERLDIWALRRGPQQTFFVMDGIRNQQR